MEVKFAIRVNLDGNEAEVEVKNEGATPNEAAVIIAVAALCDHAMLSEDARRIVGEAIAEGGVWIE
ncbi:MAG: hypothetical protein E7434_04490 [Ruminococcaceae bacterium]|nr:hypothetical protein [Oscillospiraceae bacterium]